MLKTGCWNDNGKQRRAMYSMHVKVWFDFSVSLTKRDENGLERFENDIIVDLMNHFIRQNCRVEEKRTTMSAYEKLFSITDVKLYKNFIWKKKKFT